MAELAALQLMQLVGAKSAAGGSTNQEVKAPPPPCFPHTMQKGCRIICGWLSLKSFLPTMRSRPMCRQNTCVSRVCCMTTKATCVTSAVFNCGKFWPNFDVATRSLRQCQVHGTTCHMQRGFVRAMTWGRQRMKNTCSLSIQIHKKLGNAFVRPYSSPTLILLLSSCKLRTQLPQQSLWHAANTRRQFIFHDLSFV